jgi:excisionase family DNA binding protein
MESRKHSSYAKDGSLEKKLDQLIDDIKKLPNKRQKLLEDLMKDRLYDSKEACEILSISLPSLRRSIKIGRIKTVYVGKYLRIPAHEINRLVKGEEVLTVEEAASILNVGKIMIRNLIKSGQMEAFRFADKGPFKIPRKEVEKFMKG